MIPRRPRLFALAACLLAAAGARTPAAAAGGSPAPAAAPEGECPLMPWESIHPAHFLEQDGERTYFCCARCLRQWIQADPIRLEGALARAARVGDDLDTILGGGACGSRPPEPGESLAALRGRPMDLLGRLHPLAVHFPIACFFLAALAELAFLRTGRRELAAVVRFQVAAAALTAPVAAALGWCAGGWVAYPGDLAGILRLHKWGGTALAALGLVTLALSEAVARGREPLRPLLRLALVAAVIGTGVVGYYGGVLVYGPDHYRL